MKTLKPLLEKKYSWFYLLLFALFLAFVFTFFIHNIVYFNKDFKGDYLVSNTSKISEENGVTFLFKDLNRYVREISFKSNLKTNEKKAFSIWTTNDKGEETLLKTESLYLYFRRSQSLTFSLAMPRFFSFQNYNKKINVAMTDRL